MFDIVYPEAVKTTQIPNIYHDTTNYIQLQAQFLTASFGHYTIKFASMMAEEATSKFPPLKSINLNKCFREIVKKYFLSDLQLVYVGHISGLLQWNISSCSTLGDSKKLSFQVQGEPPSLLLFINLIAFFVKKYIGQLQEYLVIEDYLNKQSQGEWKSVYEEWLKTLPKNIFKLSPREINLSYSKYARNCQQSTRNKNYNHMVDRIMELSTTYAMIPGDCRENKKQKRFNKTLKNFAQEPIKQKDVSKPQMLGRKMVKPDKVSQLEYSKRSQVVKFSEISNQFIDLNQPVKRPKIKLGNKCPKEAQINNTVTDFFSKKKNNQVVENKRYAPQSTNGFVDPNPFFNLFDSKLFSSGSEMIPYAHRSNSNIFKSKLFE